MTEIKSNPLFNLRVLLRHDDKYAIHVAHCLETGSVVTADTSEEACKMIQELLEDEILFALRHRNLKNLFSSPASLDVVMQWLKAAQEKDPDIKFLVVNSSELELREIEPKNASFENRVQIARAA